MSHFDADLNIIVEKLTTSQCDADYEKLGAEKTYKKFKTSYQQGMPRSPVNSDLSLKKARSILFEVVPSRSPIKGGPN